MRLAHALEGQEGLESANANLMGQVTLAWDDERTSREAILERLAKAGFDELMQETYARAFRSWRSFTPGTNMRAWLLRILTNLNIDRGRRQQRAPQMQPLEANDYFLYDKLAENGDGISDEEQVVERLSQDDIVTALSTVPHDFRDVLVLVDLGDFSYADAAQILDIPVGTVMSRLHRGRRILKRELAESTLEEAT